MKKIPKVFIVLFALLLVVSNFAACGVSKPSGTYSFEKINFSGSTWDNYTDAERNFLKAWAEASFINMELKFDNDTLKLQYDSDKTDLFKFKMKDDVVVVFDENDEEFAFTEIVADVELGLRFKDGKVMFVVEKILSESLEENFDIQASVVFKNNEQ